MVFIRAVYLCQDITGSVFLLVWLWLSVAVYKQFFLKQSVGGRLPRYAQPLSAH